MSEVCIESANREQWLALVPRFLDHSYRQCWDYGQLLAERRKAISHHVTIRDGSEVIGIADVRIKRAPLVGGIAYISGGPLVRRGDASELDRLSFCLDTLRRHFVDGEGLILRIQGSMGDSSWNERSKECFLSHGFSPAGSGTSYRTMALNLNRPLAEIRSSLAQKWRNCLNKAERNNPAVEFTTDVKEFESFARLFEQFVQRKGFAVDLDADFFREVQMRLSHSEALTLATIKIDGVFSAGHMSSMLGDTCVYLLGATSDQALKNNAAYLLQWSVIVRAHERGLKWYDLGGIDPAENPGVYHFKCGLGGVEMTAAGPFEAVPKTLGAKLVLSAETAYRNLKKRRQPPTHQPTAIPTTRAS